MTFANLFNNLEAQKLQAIADTRISINELEIKIQELREFITRTELERSNILESQQVADSALQQLLIAVQTIKAISPDAFDVFKEEVYQVLDTEPTDYTTAVAFLEGSNEPDTIVEEETETVLVETPLLPGIIDEQPDTVAEEENITDAVEEVTDTDTMEEKPVEDEREVIVDKQALKEELGELPTSDEISNMKKAQICNWLDKLVTGSYDRKLNVGELRQLLRSQTGLRRKARTNGNHKAAVA